jgi:hypothetical protein
MSVIETPPRDRLAIQTNVPPFAEEQSEAPSSSSCSGRVRCSWSTTGSNRSTRLQSSFRG